MGTRTLELLPLHLLEFLANDIYNLINITRLGVETLNRKTTFSHLFVPPNFSSVAYSQLKYYLESQSLANVCSS